MQDFTTAFIEAFHLLARADSDLLEIVGRPQAVDWDRANKTDSDAVEMTPHKYVF